MDNSATSGLIDQKFKPEFLERFGMPDIAYPITMQGLEAAISNPSEPAFAEMLFALQLRTREGTANWISLEPAMDRLAELIVPHDPREIIDVAGENWWVEMGPVDLARRIVTIQREDKLIAAVSPRIDGRLRIACYRPLDAKSAEYLVGLGLKPHPDDGVCMRENNWEYALDCAAGSGNWYAFDRGEAHLSYWESRIGIMQDGSKDLPWFRQRDMSSRGPAKVAMELGVHYSLKA